jgi:uncharacterized damage-inducible protein DinB
MFTLDGVCKFHGWTHASLALLLDHLSAISPANYARALPAFGFPTLQEQVIHIFNCESFWIQTLQGLPHVDRNPAECATVVDARLLQQEVRRKTHAYLSELTDQEAQHRQKTSVFRWRHRRSHSCTHPSPCPDPCLPPQGPDRRYVPSAGASCTRH